MTLSAHQALSVVKDLSLNQVGPTQIIKIIHTVLLNLALKKLARLAINLIFLYLFYPTPKQVRVDMDDHI